MPIMRPKQSLLLCIVAVFLVVASVGQLSAQSLSSTPILNNSNEVLAATVPIVYGEAAFRERILNRTQGERDPIGLVLSGGSARAFAHIGVLRYLEEQGVVPDFIISNSMGSIVGILYAAGLSPEQIFTVCSRSDISQLFDFSWPLEGGFLDTSRFSSLVAAYLGEDLRLEELPIPIMIVNEDLVTKRQVRIMEGDVIDVFEAAFALPVYFPPVEYRGHLLVDGGFTKIVPLDIAYDYTDTTIVSTTFYEGRDINLRNALSILNISIDLAKRRAGVADLHQHSDTIWIRCDVEDFSFMDFDAIDEIAQRGYHSASLQSQKLQALNARGTSPAIREFRSAFSVRETQVLRDYGLYKRVPHYRLSQQLFLGIRSFSYEGDSWYLRDDALFGLMYNLRWQSLLVSLHGGMGWNSINPSGVYASLSSRLSFHVFAPWLIEADFVLASDEGFLPTYYHKLGTEYRQQFLSDSLRTSLVFHWEQKLDKRLSIDSVLLHGGLTAEWDSPDPKGVTLYGEGAWQLAGDYNRQFIHTKLLGTIPLPLDFAVTVGYTGRYAIDGDGNIPIYLEDGFFTASQTLLNQGKRASLVNSTENFMVVGQLGAYWKPSWFKPTAGELLIFNDSEIGFFGDFLWNDEQSFVAQMAYGIRLTTNISLLGLKSLPTSLYVGYDGPSDSLLWGFMFGRRL